MDDNLSQYKDLYLQTGKEYLQSLNASLLKLEKKPDDKDTIGEIFRSAHSLKSQSAAMGYLSTGFLCHAVEDVFFEIKENRLQATPELADVLFQVFDALTASLNQIEKENKEVDLSSYAEKLKKITGVKTEGAGKSARTEPEVPKESQASVAKPQSDDVPTSDKTNQDTSLKINTIPVKVEQLDEMMNLLEELLVHRLQLERLVHELQNTELQEYYDQTGKNINALQFQIMKARAVPVKMIFDHLPRAVRDLAREEGKQIELKITGEDIELDRTIVDRLDEPLIHLIRNAVSHGIPVSARHETYTIALTAKREKDFAVISVADNGTGIDWQAVAKKVNLTTDDKSLLKKALFSGISTSEKVTQISGRGVGLEVVKKVIEECGGSVDVVSENGQGTTFYLKLPLTLAITKALLVRVGNSKYVVPAAAIDRSIKVSTANIKKTANQEAFVLEETEIPLLRLKALFHHNSLENLEKSVPNDIFVVVVAFDKQKIGLVVDEIIETQEVTIKPASEILKGNPLFAGVTILGDGQAALIINPQGLL
ncbi:MAG TPA: chemotaxis protein CheA [Methylomirabilota bacterium]|nr:chemotaxis protein CheA [Methylomirabilota bacterium]